MRVFLIGFMGSGKTTVGKPLAKVLGCRFVDMDHLICDTYHRSVAELFAELGEEGFRKLERQTLEKIVGQNDVVVATGGGTPCHFDGMRIMNDAGSTLYLRVSPEVLAARLKHGRDKRPLLRGKNDEQLLEYIRTTLALRETFYCQARIVVDCDGYSDAQIVEKCKTVIELSEK